MFKQARHNNTGLNRSICVTTETLAECLDCGKHTAIKIGTDAGAKIKIGRRVLWDIAKIKHYLDRMISDTDEVKSFGVTDNDGQ